MAAIQITDRGSPGPVRAGRRALTQAALVAIKAPSLFNSQPWRWQISGDVAQLWADRSRQILPIDPDGRLLTVSCGSALHHLRLALAVAGFTATATYLPDPADPDLLASVTVGPASPPTPRALRLFRAIAMRRTDRRPFAERPVTDAVRDELRQVVEAAGAVLAWPAEADLLTLTVAAGYAATTELADPAYRAALAAWVNRPAGSGDGVPTGAAPLAVRPVPVRDFTAAETRSVVEPDPPPVGDRHASYAVLATSGDEPADWLTAGEALSALLLMATAHGLATSPMSDVVEVPTARSLLHDLVPIGYAAIVVRIGVPASKEPAVPPTPRRRGSDVVETAGCTDHDQGG